MRRRKEASMATTETEAKLNTEKRPPTEELRRLPDADELAGIRDALAEVLEFGTSVTVDRVRYVLAADGEVAVSYEQIGRLVMHVRHMRAMCGYIGRDLALIDDGLEYLQDIADGHQTAPPDLLLPVIPPSRKRAGEQEHGS
jgi:hypothetical protein